MDGLGARKQAQGEQRGVRASHLVLPKSFRQVGLQALGYRKARHKRLRRWWESGGGSGGGNLLLLLLLAPLLRFQLLLLLLLLFPLM